MKGFCIFVRSGDETDFGFVTRFRGGLVFREFIYDSVLERVDGKIVCQVAK